MLKYGHAIMSELDKEITGQLPFSGLGSLDQIVAAEIAESAAYYAEQNERRKYDAWLAQVATDVLQEHQDRVVLPRAAIWHNAIGFLQGYIGCAKIIKAYGGNRATSDKNTAEWTFGELKLDEEGRAAAEVEYRLSVMEWPPNNDQLSRACRFIIGSASREDETQKSLLGVQGRKAGTFTKKREFSTTDLSREAQKEILSGACRIDGGVKIKTVGRNFKREIVSFSVAKWDHDAHNISNTYDFHKNPEKFDHERNWGLDITDHEAVTVMLRSHLRWESPEHDKLNAMISTLQLGSHHIISDR